MSGIRSSAQLKLKTHAYDTFMGLDGSRHITAMDTGREQHFATIENAYCDWRGQVVRGPAARPVHGSLQVVHARHFDTDRVVYGERRGDGIRLTSTEGHEDAFRYPQDAVLSSTIFNRNVHVAAKGARMRYYDGALFHQNSSPSMSLLRPSMITTVQRRLCVAGITGFETEVHISRVDSPAVFPGDEDPAEESVLRAGIIDVANLIGTADQITGLGQLEQDGLVVFTSDRAVVYRLDPDIDAWTIDAQANLRVGCVSHNTICPAGTDLLFCSRQGVHSIRRSSQNGILLGTVSLSFKIDTLYRHCFENMSDPAAMSAVYDQDANQYHVFFPQPGNRTARRLTLTLSPVPGEEDSARYSGGTFLDARCGDALAGRLVYGTNGGLYEIVRDRNRDGLPATAVAPEAYIVTPFLWHGSLVEAKRTHSFTLQASGSGIVEMWATDLEGRVLGSMAFEIAPDADDTDSFAVPLSRQYERMWQVRYLAAQYHFRITQSDGLVRISGFAVTTRQD
ncbi:hypothetical protein [Poseidonocella sp. HB161398]|uniref:hypothetical protein n=1 Tax=Poseidonocella sp. HB161398 TaxID=2320855 RepID=UPI001109CAEC|nr:hypothetical protein [Poseidonocella sp. HB161398]